MHGSAPTQQTYTPFHQLAVLTLTHTCKYVGVAQCVYLRECVSEMLLKMLLKIEHNNRGTVLSSISKFSPYNIILTHSL